MQFVERLNPHISVDCVIFGFDGQNIKTLLVKRTYRNEAGRMETDLKLPGDFIRFNEDLQEAAERVLSDLTGLRDIYLQQFRVFGHPDRISKKRDIDWLKETTGITVERIVTVAWYSLIKIDESNEELVDKNMAVWMDLQFLRELAFDHYEIVQSALSSLRRRIRYEPIVSELLPNKFTFRQLQNLYELILGKTFDNRNFRKKILKQGYLVPLNEKQLKVAHKPAQLYRFDKKKHQKVKQYVPDRL